MAKRIRDLGKVGQSISPEKIAQQVDRKAEVEGKFNLVELLRIVNKRKHLLPTKMGEMRATKIKGIEIQKTKGVVIFRGTAVGAKQETHKIGMKFFGVTFSEEKNIRHPVKASIKGAKGYMSEIKVNKNIVQVNCTCGDLSWSWSWWDKQKEVLFGKVPQEVKNYKPTGTGKPRNPGHFVGFCKHALVFSKTLKQRGLIV